MTSAERRRELRARYDQRDREAGVYGLRNTATGRVLLATSIDLTAVRNKVEFARATGTPSALDGRLAADIREFGIDTFTFEVLDVLDVTPEMSVDDVRADLVALEQLWREKLAGVELY
ncbi:MAG: GIY-YIG nuclease family protein [Candidatus Limnocylindrales bacterium]